MRSIRVSNNRTTNTFSHRIIHFSRRSTSSGLTLGTFAVMSYTSRCIWSTVTSVSARQPVFRATGNCCPVSGKQRTSGKVR